MTASRLTPGAERKSAPVAGSPNEVRAPAVLSVDARGGIGAGPVIKMIPTAREPVTRRASERIARPPTRRCGAGQDRA